MKKHMEEILNFSKTLKVLYVEDNNETREQTLKLLKNFFKHISVGVDGKDGLDKFKKSNFDIVVTDINMPNISGLKMIETIKEYDNEISCIVISAHNDTNFFIEAIKLGVDGFVIKPIDIKLFYTLFYKIIKKIQLKKRDFDYTKELEQKVKERTKELWHKLYYDDLTKLQNRAALLKELSKIDDDLFPIIFLIDIDSFRMYNELYGAEVGNEILVKLASFLKEFIKNTNYKIYRIFGDEFVLFEAVSFIDTQKYKHMTDELLKYFKKNKIYIQALDEYINIDVTIGMSFGNKNSLSKAGIALYNAKNSGKKYNIYTTHIDRSEQLKNNFYWKNEIKNALKEDRVTPYFQPIVDRNQKIVKYESLIRIVQYDKQGNKKTVTPYDFLDIAMQTKQYDDLSYRMIEKTFEILYDKNISFSVNLDYKDIDNTNTMNMIREKIKKFNLSGKQNKIIFEILEDKQIKDYPSFMKKLEQLKDDNTSIAIDDFGSGYSNLSHIVGIGPDYIKIDASLVKNVVKSHKSRRVIQGIVHLAKNLEIKTIAEYVADKKIFDIVYDLGVDEFQGYYFGKPQPANTIQKNI